MEEHQPGEARLEVRLLPSEAARSRRVFTWRNLFRAAPRVAEQPGCPLQPLRPRFYSHASLGSRIATTLRLDLRNISDKTIHSYFWRHQSPVMKANGGFGCRPQGGMAPGTCHQEAAYLPWRGRLTITIDLVQFADGTIWLTADPESAVKQAGLEAGARAAGDHLLRVWREGGRQSLTAALPRIHADVQEAAWSRERQARLGVFGFYSGVTRASVVAAATSDAHVEEALVTLQSGARSTAS